MRAFLMSHLHFISAADCVKQISNADTFKLSTHLKVLHCRSDLYRYMCVWVVCKSDAHRFQRIGAF